MLRPVFALTATLGLAVAANAQYPPFPVPPPYPVGYPQVGGPYGRQWTGYQPVGRPHHRPRCDAHVVLYKTCSHGPWVRYGTYCSEDLAKCAARDLRRAGYRVKVDDCD